jgi:hypothetical protein
MTANTLIVTQIGLDAAVSSSSGGIELVLSTFKIGSAYGYTPIVSDTALHGSILYTDSITSFSTSSDGSLIVNCTMSVEAGPFDFGEIGIYTEAGDLFALMALPALEHKYSSLGTTVASTFTFKCYLRLGQIGGVISIDSSGGGTSSFSYIMQSGQPPGVWGSEDSGDHSLVWNPSNFNVATAKNIVSTIGVSYSGSSHTFYAADGITQLGILDGSGNFTATGNVGGTSDVRYKTNIRAIENADQIVSQLVGITYETDSDRRYGGLSAQEVQKWAPEWSTVDDRGRLGVFYANMVGLLVSAHNQARNKLQAKVDELEDKVNELGRKIESGV